jgi:hypothetical protein
MEYENFENNGKQVSVKRRVPLRVVLVWLISSMNFERIEPCKI